MKLHDDFRYLKNTLGWAHASDSVVREALYSLDAIDNKAASLLQFQGLVIAASTFVITQVATGTPSTVLATLGLVVMGIAATLALLTINLLGPHTLALRRRTEHRKRQGRRPDVHCDKMLLVYIFGVRRRFYLASYALSFIGILLLTLSAAVLGTSNATLFSPPIQENQSASTETLAETFYPAFKLLEEQT